MKSNMKFFGQFCMLFAVLLLTGFGNWCSKKEEKAEEPKVEQQVETVAEQPDTTSV